MPVAPHLMLSRSGQTTVEYILLLAAVVGIIALFRSFAEPSLVKMVERVVAQVDSEAWLGGAPAGTGADANVQRPYVQHYLNQDGIRLEIQK